MGSNSNIIRISPDGAVKTIVNANERVGERLSLERLAVTGEGTIYALDDYQKVVFKFSSDGRFVNRFGGKGDQPGQWVWPYTLAVDGKGRVYVSDVMQGIHVFDGDGRHIATFSGSDGGVFGIAINDQGEIFASHRNARKIVKYALAQ